jgi:predicted amidohydrolase YtcJ
MSIRWSAPVRDVPTGAAPDLVLRGGRVYTGASGGQPRFASGLAVVDGTIVAVGDDATVTAHADAHTRVVDLEGRTVVPGLIDSHLHVVRAGASFDEELFWYETPSLEKGLAMIRDQAAATPPGTWIAVVGGWHHGQFREGRGPTPEELTRLAPEHPVYVQLLYESAVANDAALKAAGIDRNTPDPHLGSFERDAEGEPTGTVRGIGAFQHFLAQAFTAGHDARVEGTANAMKAFNRYGLTGGVDAGGFGMPPEAYDPLFQVWRDGAMTMKLRLFTCAVTRGHEAEEVAQWARHIRPGFGDVWLRHVGMGEVTHFGCHDLEGLTDFQVADEVAEQLPASLLDLARRGWPVHMHSVLDATTTAILDAWEQVDAEVPIRDLRWSLAHAEPISDANLDRVARLGAGIAVQNRMVYRATDSAARWGEDAVRFGPPLRTILDRGIPLMSGTDSTRVASPNPWVSLWWLVTGRTYDAGPERDPSQCLTRTEALKSYTSGGTWLTFEEHDRGRLAAGMAADLAVLDDDYFTVDADAIRRLGADLTVVEGRVVHARAGFGGLADD